MLIEGSLQRSSVLTTRAAAESISGVNISFCTSRNILDRLLKRVALTHHFRLPVAFEMGCIPGIYLLYC
jgi:hypothetical protein